MNTPGQANDPRMAEQEQRRQKRNQLIAELLSQPQGAAPVQGGGYQLQVSPNASGISDAARGPLDALLSILNSGGKNMGALNQRKG